MKALALLLVSLVALPDAGFAQGKRWGESEADRKEIACRNAGGSLIGKARTEVRELCGTPTRSALTQTETMAFEALSFGPYFTVFLRNGVVTAVREHQ